VERRLFPDASETGGINRGRVSLGVAVSGYYAFLETGRDFGNGSMEIIDISDPTNPRSRGEYTFHNFGARAAALGNYVYLANGSLQVLDVSDPANPKLVATDPAPAS
jgi:hypothetical protein